MSMLCPFVKIVPVNFNDYANSEVGITHHEVSSILLVVQRDFGL